MNTEINNTASAKRAWVRPELKRLEAGAAESVGGPVADGGGGGQGS